MFRRVLSWTEAESCDVMAVSAQVGAASFLNMNMNFGRLQSQDMDGIAQCLLEIAADCYTCGPLLLYTLLICYFSIWTISLCDSWWKQMVIRGVRTRIRSLRRWVYRFSMVKMRIATILRRRSFTLLL